MRHPEREEQIAFFRWTELVKYKGVKLHRYCYSVPNELPFSGKKAMLAMLNMRAAGLTKGVPDVECMIAIPPFTGWHGEFKKSTGKPSDVSADQEEIMKMLASCGRKCDVCYGAEDGMKKLGAYLGNMDR